MASRVKVPQLPRQSVPINQDRGGDPELPLIFGHAWFLFLEGMVGSLGALSSSVDTLPSTTQEGTHAARASIAASAFADGAIFVETDRNGLIYQVQGGVWVYVGGTYQRTQSQLSALASALTVNDNGLLVHVTDYNHVLRWANPAWGWGPGDDGSGKLVPFAVAPTTGTGWHLADGATVNYLKADGTTGSVTLPNTASTPAYTRNGPAYSSTIAAATVPTISTPTISTPTISTPTITVDNATLGTGNFTAGVVAAVTQTTHGHTASSSTPTSSTPTSSTPTATLPADPVPNFPAPLYFRI